MIFHLLIYPPQSRKFTSTNFKPKI